MKVRTNGTCCRSIEFDVKDGKVYGVSFDGGCRGNHQAVANLCEGRAVDEVVSLLKGIQCRNGTSCPDQLAVALERYKSNLG